MNAFPLFNAEGKRVGVFACGNCRKVYETECTAALCCEPTVCPCGVVAPRYRILCEACTSAALEQRQQRVWDDARKLPAVESSGPVWNEDTDEFHDSFDSFWDSWEDEADERDPDATPPRVFACEPFGTVLDAERILEHALEDHHEDAISGIDDGAVAQLQQQLDGWAREHGPTSWHPNYDIAIIWDSRKSEGT